MNFLGAAIGFLIALFSAIAIILFWPIRVLLKRVGLIKPKAVPQEEEPRAAEAG
jgi:hypothetical protein